MNTSRRRFLKQSTLAVSGSLLLSNALLAGTTASRSFVGLQLYSVRDDMKKDPAGTLKQLAAMGYTHVEHAGYEDRKFYGYEPAAFKKLLADLGLIMLSGHSFVGADIWNKKENDFTDSWKHTVEDAAMVGMQYVISPGVDESLCKKEDDFKWYLQLYNKTGELCKKSGIQFAYHNETFEFNHYLNKKRIYDLLLDGTDKSLVAQQIDIGNMYPSGGRGMDYLKRYPGRFFSMHVKDEIKSNTHDEGFESCVLGKGIVGTKEILAFARQQGSIRQYIIEQESYGDQTPLACAKDDLAMMKQWGFWSFICPADR